MKIYTIEYDNGEPYGDNFSWPGGIYTTLEEAKKECLSYDLKEHRPYFKFINAVAYFENENHECMGTASAVIREVPLLEKFEEETE